MSHVSPSMAARRLSNRCHDHGRRQGRGGPRAHVGVLLIGPAVDVATAVVSEVADANASPPVAAGRSSSRCPDSDRVEVMHNKA